MNCVSARIRPADLRRRKHRAPRTRRIDLDRDAHGRVWRKTVKRADGTVETQAGFVFDTATNGVGQPASETISGTYTGWAGNSALAHSYSRSYGYDGLGRATSASTTIGGGTYTQATVLDALGRAWKAQDASGHWSKTEYGPRGFAAALCASTAADGASTCADAWQRTQATDAWGNVVREVRAGSAQIPITRSYNPLNGLQTGLCAGKTDCDLVSEMYAWDANGNLAALFIAGRACRFVLQSSAPASLMGQA
ncbi:MAG: hypothetical protein JSS52_01195 [Proteobacteria bacterium]|nr:hypothetical protein [Pseudomonadota bacterium]